jgi:hypothetical protein
VWYCGKNQGRNCCSLRMAYNKSVPATPKSTKHVAIFLAGHLHIWIYESNAIDQPLDRKARTINRGPLSGKDSFHVPAQRPYKGGDNGHKQHVLNCAV